MGYPRDGMWQQQQLVKMIKNGEISVVYGTDNTTVGTLALSGTSLSYTRDSVSYPIYTWFRQLD